MNNSLSLEEIKLARKIINLRGTSFIAKTNYLELTTETPTILSLKEKKYIEPIKNGYQLTTKGIDQLRLQIGEFRFKQVGQ